MKNVNLVDTLITNIKTDQELLENAETQIEKAKEEKRGIVDRLKDYRRDVATFLKYANEEQQRKLQELGFDFSESERGMNPVATMVLDIIMKAKDKQMKNGEVYQAYVDSFKDAKDAFNYTEFNIKCRSLFNTQRLLRKKGTDPKNTREDIISLNGRVIEKPLNGAKGETKTTKTDVQPKDTTK